MLPSVVSLAALICAILAGCPGSGTPGGPASSSHVFGPPGSAGNPLVLSCDARFGPSLWFRPRPGDLVIGPLDLAGGKAVATMTPAKYGYSSDGHGGRVFKLGRARGRGGPGPLTIAPPARVPRAVGRWVPRR